jgi:hypothetical protein
MRFFPSFSHGSAPKFHLSTAQGVSELSTQGAHLLRVGMDVNHLGAQMCPVLSG